MTTRMIVVLVVGGAALVVAPRLYRGSPESSPPPSPTTLVTEDAESAPARSASATVAAPPPTSTSTTIAGVGAVEGVDRLEHTEPLTQHLPHDAPHFRVDYRVGPGDALTLQITLRAVLNRADQREAYRTDLSAYKAEALEWIRSVGADPSAYSIEWRPPEAAGL